MYAGRSGSLEYADDVQTNILKVDARPVHFVDSEDRSRHRCTHQDRTSKSAICRMNTSRLDSSRSCRHHPRLSTGLRKVADMLGSSSHNQIVPKTCLGISNASLIELVAGLGIGKARGIRFFHKPVSVFASSRKNPLLAQSALLAEIVGWHACRCQPYEISRALCRWGRPGICRLNQPTDSQCQAPLLQ